MPALSIVLPAYNAESFIREALDRVDRQTLDDIEIVVVDDGSRDATAELIAAAAAEHPRLRAIILPENVGVSAARRQALAACTGDYVWLIDTDDHPAPDGAERMLAAAKAADADVVLARADFVYSSGERRPVSTPAPGTYDREQAFRHLLTGRASGHLWNKLFRREVVAGAEFVPARVHSDLALVASALARADRFVATDIHVYDYRLRSGSIITTKRSRAASLDTVGDAVARAASVVGIEPGDGDFDYFRCRYLTLSAIKDLVATGIDRDRLRMLRRRIGLAEVRAIVGRRDARRLALALSAKTSLPAYRVMLKAAER